MSKQFLPASADSSKEVLAGTVIKGDRGDNAIIAVPMPGCIVVPCGLDGTPSVYPTCDIMIVSGGSLLAEIGSLDGWSAAVVSSTLCSFIVTPSVLQFQLTGVTANSASFKARFSKTGYADIYTTVKVVKVYKGATGDASTVPGDPGVDATGIPGANGLNGDGLVMFNHRVKVLAPLPATVSNQGGFCRLTFATNHILFIDDRVQIFNIIDYNNSLVGTVTNTVSAIIVDTDIPYVSNQSVDVRSMRHFCHSDRFQFYAGPMMERTPQWLEFPNIIPVGGKIDELAVIKRLGTTNYLFWNLGTTKAPASGYNSYMSGVSTNYINEHHQVNLWDTARSGYSAKFIVSTTDPRRNLYAYCTLYYPGYDWADMADNEWDIYFSYKNFN